MILSDYRTSLSISMRHLFVFLDSVTNMVHNSLNLGDLTYSQYLHPSKGVQRTILNDLSSRKIRIFPGLSNLINFFPHELSLDNGREILRFVRCFARNSRSRGSTTRYDLSFMMLHHQISCLECMLMNSTSYFDHDSREYKRRTQHA
jgi:hypothetical protein